MIEFHCGARQYSVSNFQHIVEDETAKLLMKLEGYGWLRVPAGSLNLIYMNVPAFKSGILQDEELELFCLANSIDLKTLGCTPV